MEGPKCSATSSGVSCSVHELGGGVDLGDVRAVVRVGADAVVNQHAQLWEAQAQLGTE